MKVGAAGVAQAGVCPTTNVIQDPPAFQWTYQGTYWSGTLEIGPADRMGQRVPFAGEFELSARLDADGDAGAAGGPPLRRWYRLDPPAATSA